MKIPYWTLAVVPTAVWYFGFALNAIAIAANHGAMPVLFPQVMLDMGLTTLAIARDTGDTIHSVMTSDTHLKFLCDWILIRNLGIASIGDCFEWFGELTQIPGYIACSALVLNKLGLFKD